VNRINAQLHPHWDTRVLLVVTAALVVFGVAAVYGASSIVAVQQGEPGSYFAVKQLLGALCGGLLLAVISHVDYHVWERQAWTLIGIVSIMLIILVLPFTGAVVAEINGARRWIEIFHFRFQPSELAKFAIVAWTAKIASKKGVQVGEFKKGVVPFMVVAAPMALLILLEPDLSTTFLFCLLFGIVLFAGGARMGHILVLGAGAGLVAWRYVMGRGYAWSRIAAFLGDHTQANWQIQQSLTGFGSGRLFGVGFGEGTQKMGYLPYAYSDFIYSTIGEEWGFVGAVAIALLFLVFILVGLRIARSTDDPFGSLLAVGLTAIVGVSAILHMAVTLGAVPTTGLTLPFVSYGRTSLIVALVATGVLINIGRQRPPVSPKTTS
jgi:cell division protein FtsW